MDKKHLVILAVSLIAIFLVGFLVGYVADEKETITGNSIKNFLQSIFKLKSEPISAQKAWQQTLTPSKEPEFVTQDKYVEVFDIDNLPLSVTTTELAELSDLGDELNFLGNLAPFPTKSLQPYWKLKQLGIVDKGQVNLERFYLQEGPLTQITPHIQEIADSIEDGSTTRETVTNIMQWDHNIRCSEQERQQLIEELEAEDQRRSRSAEEIISSGCGVGCRDFAIVFATLARTKGIPATVTETVREGWVAPMVWQQQWDGYMYGHFFSEVYLPEERSWIVINPVAKKVTGRDNKGYYINGPEDRWIYLLFERGLDNYDYGVETMADFAGTVKRRYYINGAQP